VLVRRSEVEQVQQAPRDHAGSDGAPERNDRVYVAAAPPRSNGSWTPGRRTTRHNAPVQEPRRCDKRREEQERAPVEQRSSALSSTDINTKAVKSNEHQRRTTWCSSSAHGGGPCYKLSFPSVYRSIVATPVPPMTDRPPPTVAA
jgi:hypothetical protein